jgi:Secretion system C-terminal sorting domain
MKRFTKNYLSLTLLLSFFCQVSIAQFQIVPLKNTEKIKPSSARITALTLPFFDDFSTSINRQDQSKWQKDGGVSINNTFTNNHPTLNVATFDGLNANGSPYDFVNSLSEGPNDTLTSLPIDLSINPTKGGAAYTVADSLYLSFFYRGQGLGDKPDLRDSLRLQFLTNGNIWKTVWIDSAQTVSSQFKQVIIPVRANIYLHSAFQFRFQSYGRQSGQFDVWHVDYVYLDEIKNNPFSRNASDKNPTTKEVTTIYTRDFAARNPTTSLLKNYSAMPMWQFLAKPEKELADSVKSDVNNLSTIALRLDFPSYTVKNLLTNQTIQRKDSIAIFVPLKSYGTLKVKTNLNLNELKKDTTKAYLKLSFDVKSGDKSPFSLNDTISKYVDLNNYYAYDDGTAEQAAEIKKGFGRVAVQYIVNKPDAVSAIRINLQPTVKNIAKQRLTFQILANDKGKIGRILKTISDTINVIKYSNSVNAFVEYKIDPVAVTDTFYVGFIQFTDDEPLAIGLDLNTPQFANKHYYNISNEWIQVPKADAPQVNSTFIPIKGSLMIRPVMLGKTIAAKPLANEEEIQDKNLVISPNPSSGIFRWNDESLKNVEVYDMTGRIIFQERSDNQEVNLQNLRTGIYFLRLSNEKNTFVRKIVKE